MKTGSKLKKPQQSLNLLNQQSLKILLLKRTQQHQNNLKKPPQNLNPPSQLQQNLNPPNQLQQNLKTLPLKNQQLKVVFEHNSKNNHISA